MSVRRHRVAGWALALLAMALFASLGSWQLGRMHEKQAMLDAAAQTVAGQRSVPLSAAGDTARLRDYDWAEGEGRFLDVPAVLLDNQQRNGRAGVRVYHAFQPDGAPPLLVELGWLGLPADRTMPSLAPPPGRQHLRGLLAPPPSGGLAPASPSATGPGDVLVLRLEPAALAAALALPALPPRVLRLDPALPIGHARDLEVLPNTLPPAKHLGYAVQWFGLALTVLVVALILTFRRSRP